MKTHLQILKSFAIALVLLMTATVVNAATRTASVSGNWDNTATWGGASVPVAGDDVIINAGITVTVNVAAACNSVTFGFASGTLTVNSGITLDVTTSITLQNSNTANTAATLAGAGTINCASVQVGGFVTAPTADRTTTLTSTITALNISGNLTIRSEDNGGNQGHATFNLGSGSVTVNTTVVLDADSDGGTLPISTISLNTGAETGTLTLPGSTPFSTPGAGTVVTDLDGTGPTVNYSGAAQTVRATPYRNLVLSGSGVKTTTGITINGMISLQGTCTVGNTFTYSTAILEYKGSAAQTTSTNEFPASTSGIDEVIIDNPSGVTLDAGKTLNGNLTLTSGTLAAGTFLTMGATGTPLITRSEGAITGTLQGTNDYDVTYTGNSKTTGPELNNGGLADVGVNLTTGQTLTLDANRTPDGNLTLTEGTFDLSTFTINRSGAGGTLTVSDGATLKIGGTNTFPSNYTTHSIGNTSATVEYAGTAQAVAAIAGAEVYTNLTLSGSGIKTFAAETVNGTLSIQGTATTAGSSVTYGATATLEYAGTASMSSSNVEFPAASPFNLRMNGSATITLHATRTIAIGGSLTLTNGVLVTTTTNLLILSDNATSSGGSTSSYVSGPLRKIGNDAFTFRVGKVGLYSPISITAPNSTGDVFQAEYRRESGTALGGITAPGIFRVSNCEYWDLDEITDAGTANTIDVTAGWFSYSGCGSAPYISDYTAIRLVHFDEGGTNMWNTSGGTPSGDNTTGTVTRTGVTVFSPFTLGSTLDNGNALPVNLVNVKAFEKNSGVQIEWTNLTEVDLVNYFVERSANGRDFTAVGQVAPRSNSGDRESYISFDPSPLSGVSYYRIRAVEIDGKSVFSKSLRVVIGSNPKGIVLYPNPVTGNEVSIGFSAEKGQYTLRVMNSVGQQVYTQQVNHQGGTITQTIVLPASVKSGVYHMLITGDNYKENKMFVVQ